MTEEQMDELMTVAVNMQRDAEIDCNRPSAMFAYAVQVAVLELRKVRDDSAALAAENAGLKNQLRELFNSCDTGESRGNGSLSGAAVPDWCVLEKTRQFLESAPTTDAFLADVRAHARNEGINYAAGRLAAAFNHGFIDKPMTEVCDVVRMILDTKEELANSTLPADDGLSGEYAEAFIEDSAAQISQEAAQ